MTMPDTPRQHTADDRAHDDLANRTDQPAPAAPMRSATGAGIVGLVLDAAALISTPMLILLPWIGFLPAVLAAAGAIVAGRGLHCATGARRLAVTGLIAGIVLFALLAGTATMWHVVVADPAISDYTELHEVIDYIKSLIFG